MSKRSLCFAAAMVFLTLSASALTAQTKWMGGPFVGLNYTTIAGDSVKDTGYRAGLAADSVQRRHATPGARAFDRAFAGFPEFEFFHRI